MNKKIILFSILLITIYQINSDIYLPSFLAMTTYFEVKASAIQFSVILAMIFFSISLLIYGPLSDHFGRKKIALIGIFIFLIGSVISIFSFHIFFLYLGRIFQGLGVGCCGAVSPAIVRDVFSGRQMIKTFSQISTIIAITPMIAPILGGYLQDFFAWQASFVFVFIYALIIFFYFIHSFPETHPYIKEHPLTFRKILHSYFYVLSNKRFLGATFLMVITDAAELAYLIIAPFLLQKELGYSAVGCGWIILLSSVIGYMIGTFFSSILSHKWPSKRVIFSGVILLICSSISMFILSLIAFNVYTLTIPIFFFIMGIGLINPSCMAIGVESFPKNAGVAGALITGLQKGGAGLLAIGVTFFHLRNQLPLSFLLISSSFLAIVIFLISQRHLRTRIVEKESKYI